MQARKHNMTMKKPLHLAAAVFGTTLLVACATTGSVAACADYCTTQDEGYEWALRANLLDAKGCAGYAPAFTEGCRQAVSDGVLSANPRNAY